ncbi:hypothetical protein OIV19_05280 [Brucella sp. HL-2]|nr:hypothetical protein [Brucella sp. HL-2]MCV9907032.1 hypothetical protein [Brucella sp. HL-2]
MSTAQRWCSRWKVWFIRLASFAAALLIIGICANNSSAGLFWHREKKATIAGRHYIVPEDYSRTATSDDGRGIYIKVSRTDFRALARDVPGWDDNILILVQSVNNTVSELWDSAWDGSPSHWKTEITKQYEIPGGFVVREYDDGWDTILGPDETPGTPDFGFMRCSRPKPIVGYAPDCTLMFDRNKQRWQVTFGRQFVENYKEIRRKAEQLIDSFEVDK